MRKWGAVITIAYVLIVVGLLLPGATFLVGAHGSLWGVYKAWIVWIPIGIVVAGQALLLFLSVDTSWRRLKPRAHVLVSCLLTATLLALVTGAGVLSLGFAAYGDKFGGHFLDSGTNLMVCWGGLWVAWTVFFYLYSRNSPTLIARAASWLLKGSVLELLVAVPSHIIVRRRHDCSAPVVTSFGIATGIAIMLLSFGPSVLLLYKKRMDEYKTHDAAAK
jgi:hypothetical protein